MKKDIAEKWVAALRNGNYKQGSGGLLKDGNYCCLGVLCEVTETPKYYSDVWSQHDVGFGTDESYCAAYLPEFTIEVSGMKGINPKTASGVGLTYLNDTGKSFSEIADVIEKEWEQL